MSYTTTLETVRTAGIGVVVENETLGTGDNANKSFDTDNANVIAGSYTLKYGAASGNDVNSFTELTETTHYTIDKDSGTILLTTAGVTALGTNVLYIDYTHSPKMNDTVISHMITRAESDLELLTGNYWGTVKSTTEDIDGREEARYPETDYPYVYEDYNTQDFVQLKYRSVQSITTVKFYNRNHTSSRTLDSSEYYFTSYGRLSFTSDLPVGHNTVEVTYTHGYETTPTYVRQAVELISSIMIFANITGGSYDDATSFTLGRKSIGIGEVYVNVRESVRQFETQLDSLLTKLGKDLFAC